MAITDSGVLQGRTDISSKTRRRGVLQSLRGISYPSHGAGCRILFPALVLTSVSVTVLSTCTSRGRPIYGSLSRTTVSASQSRATCYIGRNRTVRLLTAPITLTIFGSRTIGVGHTGCPQDIEETATPSCLARTSAPRSETKRRTRIQTRPVHKHTELTSTASVIFHRGNPFSSPVTVTSTATTTGFPCRSASTRITKVDIGGSLF